MPNFHRYTITKRKSEWTAYCKSTQKEYNEETKDRLWTLVKKETNAVAHIRRKGKWVAFYNVPDNKIIEKEEEI